MTEESNAVNDNNNDGHDGRSGSHKNKHQQEQQILILTITSCLSGLALISKGADAESAFARGAIMPILRSKLSMGKLDEGGSLGECAGFSFLLDDVVNIVRSMHVPISGMSEGMFVNNNGNSVNNMEVDLVMCRVWVAVATALITGHDIKIQ